MDGTPIQQGLDVNIRLWYRGGYPTDNLWKDIADITFGELLANLLLYDADTTYPLMGDDSIIRERLFSGLSEITGMTYDNIYDIWTM